MHIQFFGKVKRSLKAELVGRLATVGISSSISKTDKAAIDEMAALKATKMPAFIFITAIKHAESVGLPGWITFITGDFSSDALNVNFQFSLSDFKGEPERHLVAMSEGEWDVEIEVSNQQMSFRDIQKSEQK